MTCSYSFSLFPVPCTLYPMGEQITIRRVTMDDVEELVRLRHEMQVELEEQSGGVHPDDIVGAMRDYFTKQLNGYHFTAFFAVAGERVVGTGAFVIYDTPPSPSNPSGTDAYIMNMYTLPEWRGRDIARKILDRLIEQAYSEGARRVWLRTSPKARPVYESLGFESRDNYMQKYLRE
jgi:GNAT superfamily N-acetyltransferase